MISKIFLDFLIWADYNVFSVKAKKVSVAIHFLSERGSHRL